jgi:hypothetical protein
LRLLLCPVCLQLLLKLLQALLVQLLCLMLGFLLFYKGKAALLVCPALAHLVAAPARLPMTVAATAAAADTMSSATAAVVLQLPARSLRGCDRASRAAEMMVQQLGHQALHHSSHITRSNPHLVEMQECMRKCDRW